MGKSHPLLNWERNAIRRFNKCALFLAQHIRMTKISVLKEEGIIKNFYELRVYESVDDSSLS